MDVISSNLSGFVKWQPDRETEELCFVGRTWHSGTRCCGWQGMHWQTHWQLKSLHVCRFWAQVLPLRHAAICHHPALPLVLINLYMLTCQSSSGNLKRWVGIKIVEIWGPTLAPPTSCPTTECPKNGVWIWIEMEERRAGELKVHTNRLRKRKSKCSENKPHKLLQPLGNLLKAHKTRFCYNTWSYNGDPFQIFSFFFFVGPFFSFRLNRTWRVNEGLAVASVAVH